MATINTKNNHNNTASSKPAESRYEKLQREYASLRRKQYADEAHLREIKSRAQMGKVMKNFDKVVELFEINIDKIDIEASLLRQEMYEIGEAEWKAAAAERRAEALLKKAQEQAQALASNNASVQHTASIGNLVKK